jgi:hypothetical protein
VTGISLSKDPSTDWATIAKIKDHSTKNLGLEDIQILVSDGAKTTLKLVGYNLLQAHLDI